MRLEISGSWCIPVPKIVKPALAAEGVVDAQLDRPLGVEGRDRLARQRLVEVVDRPGGVAEEAVVSAVVAAMDGARGLDQLGDVAVAVREAPAGGDGEEGGEGGRGEDGAERE